MKQSNGSQKQSTTEWVKPPGARGTAAMDPETRKRVASLGGQKVSKNREHMAALGRKGGRAISANRAHMSKIGAVGGSNSRKGGAE